MLLYFRCNEDISNDANTFAKSQSASSAVSARAKSGRSIDRTGRATLPCVAMWRYNLHASKHRHRNKRIVAICFDGRRTETSLPVRSHQERLIGNLLPFMELPSRRRRSDKTKVRRTTRPPQILKTDSPSEFVSWVKYPVRQTIIMAHEPRQRTCGSIKITIRCSPARGSADCRGLTCSCKPSRCRNRNEH